MRLSIIAAMGPNKEIGYMGKIPWHLRSDLLHFKALTQNHTVVMGRKTFASLGRPLPNRTNIIISHSPDFAPADCLIASSLEQCLHLVPSHETETFFIGGSNIYALALTIASRMYITEVNYSGPADTFFPAFDESQWQIVSKTNGVQSNKDQYPFSYIVYKRVDYR